MTLRACRWGRLCGEQEDARSALASYLGVPLRVALPLDWDHVWSEYQQHDGQSSEHQQQGAAAGAASSSSSAAAAETIIAEQHGEVRREWPLEVDGDGGGEVGGEAGGEEGVWAIHEGKGDAPAANFAARLDEGIGAWSGVLLISPCSRSATPTGPSLSTPCLSLIHI